MMATSTSAKNLPAELPEARSRGAPLAARSLLVAAEPSEPRTGFLLRHLHTELKQRKSVVVVDFGGVEGELLATFAGGARCVIVDVDSRDGILPLGGWWVLPARAKEAVGELLESWLRPLGHLRDSTEAGAVIRLVARLPLLLPRLGLYTWRRYLIDRGFRRQCVRALRREGLEVSPLLQSRPGTWAWDMLRQRVERVLGHDETLDRVFPVGEPGGLLEPVNEPEARIFKLETPWGRRAERYSSLLWFHLLAALAGRPTVRCDGRSHVGRIVLIDPPEDVWGAADLLPELGSREIGVTVVASNARPLAPPEAWFGHAPAVVVQRAFDHERLANWGYLDERDARKLRTRHMRADLLYVHQRGAPLERWCALWDGRPKPALPRPDALLRARAEGRRRFLVERARVVQNRRRLEAHAVRATRRGATWDLLERALGLDRLTRAWRRVFRNKGAPGVDKVTVEEYAETWQQQLVELQSAVREGRYRPRPYRRVWGEKASGEDRPMAIPTVADRVLMGAAADVLSTVLEPHFSERSFAYRAGRNARDAVRVLASSPRMGRGWALIADIASCFDSLDHRLLLAMLREHVADDGFVRLVASWIQSPTVDAGQEIVPRKGVPQGSPISPALANLCLTPLDRWMERRGLDYVRYADDFVALCEDERAAKETSGALRGFLARELKLSVKPAKTAFVSVAEGFEFLGFCFLPSGPCIPESRLEEARGVVAQIFSSEAAPAETLARLDPYVRGFRNYFDLGTPSTRKQLSLLEADRVQQIDRWARAHRLDLSLVLGRSERFHVEEKPSRVPGIYDEDPRSTSAGAEAPKTPDPGPVTSLMEVDRRPAAARKRAEGRRPIAVIASGHLAIFGHGGLASVEDSRFVVRKKEEILFEAPLIAIRTVQIDSYGMSLTTPLLQKLAEHDIPVLFARHGEKPWAALRPLAARGSASLLRAQLAAQGGALAFDVASALVSAKLANQARLLRYYAKYRGRRAAAAGSHLLDAADLIVTLAATIRKVPREDLAAARRKIFSIEGRAGAVYWAALRRVLGETFPGRTGQGATDPVNAALNYGYGILYGAVWGAVAKSGLDPGIGMLHASPGDRAALVFDLIEPFRVPAVDRPVVSLFSRKRAMKLNTDRHLTSTSRKHLATVVGQALERKTPWWGKSRTLGRLIDDHAVALASWLQGGRPMEPLRIRW